MNALVALVCTILFLWAGPVIDVSSVIPFNIKVGNTQTIFLQWRLADDSIPAARYIVTNQEGDGVGFFFSISSETTRYQFINLKSGIDYTFTIVAVSIADPAVESPAVIQVWRAGENTRKQPCIVLAVVVATTYRWYNVVSWKAILSKVPTG